MGQRSFSFARRVPFPASPLDPLSQLKGFERLDHTLLEFIFQE